MKVYEMNSVNDTSIGIWTGSSGRSRLCFSCPWCIPASCNKKTWEYKAVNNLRQPANIDHRVIKTRNDKTLLVHLRVIVNGVAYAAVTSPKNDVEDILAAPTSPTLHPSWQLQNRPPNRHPNLKYVQNWKSCSPSSLRQLIVNSLSDYWHVKIYIITCSASTVEGVPSDSSRISTATAGPRAKTTPKIYQ